MSVTRVLAVAAAVLVAVTGAAVLWPGTGSTDADPAEPLGSAVVASASPGAPVRSSDPVAGDTAGPSSVVPVAPAVPRAAEEPDDDDNDEPDDDDPDEADDEPDERDDEPDDEPDEDD